jgi:hypothetical protein
MAKVSIGLRGWRFEESELFDEAGEFRPLDTMSDSARTRLVRLTYLQAKPCDGCYLIHGEANKKRCKQAQIVYGEPMEEVLLCETHESDFLYWFREAGGNQFIETEAFRRSFVEWFDAGNRAPDGYEGLTHVDVDPHALPDPPDPAELQKRLNDGYTDRRKRINLRTGEITYERTDQAHAEQNRIQQLDLSREYPTNK